MVDTLTGGTGGPVPQDYDFITSSQSYMRSITQKRIMHVCSNAYTIGVCPSDPGQVAYHG